MLLTLRTATPKFGLAPASGGYGTRTAGADGVLLQNLMWFYMDLCSWCCTRMLLTLRTATPKIGLAPASGGYGTRTAGALRFLGAIKDAACLS